VIACDRTGRFTLFNQIARNFYGWTEATLRLDPESEIFPIYLPDGQTAMKKEERPLYRALQGEQVRDSECILKSKQCEARYHLVNASPLVNPAGERWGGIAVFTDITERKQAAEAQAALLAELQQALKENKTLRGLIPICAHCKKIRDDTGFWQQVDVYVRAHTEAEFTHSICPPCSEKLYAEYVQSRSK
jgi:PAS domain S-box-containing protein